MRAHHWFFFFFIRSRFNFNRSTRLARDTFFTILGGRACFSFDLIAKPVPENSVLFHGDREDVFARERSLERARARRQELETLINEEAFRISRYLRLKGESWVPGIPVP